MWDKIEKKFGGWELVFIYLLLSLVFLYKCTSYNRYELSDYVFLYNRLEQLRTCITDGVYPFFYYADALGAGHGSTFFYGQLTLIPFLFIRDYVTFTLVYTLSAVSILYFGLRSFYKRFSGNYRELSIITVYSSYGLYMVFRLNHMSCNILALGLSFFFCAFCIDFFRDGKKFYKAVCMFFLILNTHLVTTLVSFAVCCYIFIYYFKLKRFKEYAMFALSCCSVGIYAICNYAYHAEVLSADRINRVNDALWETGTQYLTNNIFETVTVDMLLRITDNNYFAFMGLTVFLVCIVYWLIGGIKHQVFLSVLLALVIISTRYGWGITHLFLNTRIQFPTRYFIFVVTGFFLVCLKDVEADGRGVFKIIFWLQIPELIICLIIAGQPYAKASADTSEEVKIISRYVANGEYLSERFDIDYFFANNSRVVDRDGKTYEYEVLPNMVVVHDVPSDVIIQVPKLYYKGYTAKLEDGTRLDIREGCGQFCIVSTDSYSGDIYVSYEHPLFLKILYVMVWCFFACFLCFCVRDKLKLYLRKG